MAAVLAVARRYTYTHTYNFMLHALGMLRLFNTPYYKATYRYAPS